MKVLVIGAGGFVGSHTVKYLLANDCGVRCLVREASSRAKLPAEGVEWAVGDVTKPETLAKASEGMDAAVNIVHMGTGAADQIAGAIRSGGIHRLVAIGTTAVFTTLASTHRQKRLDAESALFASGLDVTIVRPTMIYGTRHDRNMCRLIKYLRRYPLIPVIGSGTFLQQPVHVDDVAQSIFKSLQNSASIGKAYNVSGQNALPYNEVIDTISRLMGRRVLRLHVPAVPVTHAMRLAERFKIKLPVKSEQVQRLNEHKAFSHAEAARDFDYQPRTFADGIASALTEMGLLKNNGC